jgi:type IV pilus assembly protein PilW
MMMHLTRTPYRQRGLSLLELLIALGLTMVMVTAAGYVYLGTRETQRALESSSSSAETGAFALQLIGRDVMNAGFYPGTMPSISVNLPRMHAADTYPPAVANPARPTDWQPPAAAYNTPVFGCEGAKFDHVTGTCPAAVTGAPDSIVINYFTNESIEFGGTVGQRRDCTGADVGPADLTKGDPSNGVRRLNTPASAPTAVNADLPPQRPLFVSNRYALNATDLQVDGQAVATQSLACGGNGKSKFGTADTTAYQPLLAGINDLQLTYGLFNSSATRAPDRFYTATEVNALATQTIDGVAMAPWARVVAVRICLITKTLSGPAKIADKAGALRSYLNCADTAITPAATDTSIYKRHVQVFAIRNRLNQGF